jgi:hypothetical protein
MELLSDLSDVFLVQIEPFAPNPLMGEPRMQLTFQHIGQRILELVD